MLTDDTYDIINAGRHLVIKDDSIKQTTTASAMYARGAGACPAAEVGDIQQRADQIMTGICTSFSLSIPG